MLCKNNRNAAGSNGKIMQDLTIGLFQFDQVWQDKKANFELIAKQLTTAPKLDVLLLPEMFHTGFSMEMSCADDWQQSKGLDFLKKLSQSHQMAIYTSLMVKDGSAFFNRGVFVFPDGEVVKSDTKRSDNTAAAEG